MKSTFINLFVLALNFALMIWGGYDITHNIGNQLLEVVLTALNAMCVGSGLTSFLYRALI